MQRFLLFLIRVYQLSISHFLTLLPPEYIIDTYNYNYYLSHDWLFLLYAFTELLHVSIAKAQSISDDQLGKWANGRKLRERG